MALRHNIKKPRIWKVAIHKTCGNREGTSTTFHYERLIKWIRCQNGRCWEKARTRVHVVQQRNNNKGAITAYCVGRSRCPDWLNRLPIVESTQPEAARIDRAHVI